jgi:hypothetical protein
MGIIPNLVMGVVSLIMVAIDVAVVLVLVRLATSRWHNRLLTAMDVAGRPFVDELAVQVDRLWAWLRTAPRLSTRGRLLAALGMLMVLRLVLASLCVLVSR